MKPALADFIDRVRLELETLLDASTSRTWVVAVSGGPDSVALLRLLHGLSSPLGLTLSVAHLDHGTRGQAGREDARFVEELSRNLKLDFDLGSWAPSRPAHFEADARRARYDWLAEVARNRGAAAVAVAHTRDDQAETILHRILRGTGPLGLRGMAARRELGPGVDLVRPLLRFRREQLTAYLAELDQPFRVDASNADLSRTRNRIRRDLLPKLAREYNPEIVEALTRVGDLIAEMEPTPTVREADVIRRETDDSVEFLIDPFRELCIPARTELLRRVWRRLRLPESRMSAEHWRRLAGWADRHAGTLNLPEGCVASITTSGLLVGRPPVERTAERATPVPVALDEITAAFGMSFFIGNVPSGSAEETLDADAIVPPLVLDRPRPGDRFDPLGMNGKTQALADFLRGRGLNAKARSEAVVLRDAVGIVWVVGHRISHRARVTEGTRRRLRTRHEISVANRDRSATL